MTLSGPPSTLSALLENNAELASFPSSKLGITAAYHASHLGAPDVARILRNVTSSDLPIRKGTRLVSTSSGVPYESSSLGEILQLVLDDILLKPLRLDLAIEDLANFAKDADVQMMILGPCGLTKTIRQTLVSHGASVSTTGAAQVDDLRDEQYHPDSIAVVGMSGRFPGGDNIDEFWQVIATGKDVHTKVSPWHSIIRLPLKSGAGTSGSLRYCHTLRPFRQD